MDLEAIDRALPDNLIPITETLLCKFALCLSNRNIYRIALSELALKPPKGSSDPTEIIFGARKSNLINHISGNSSGIKPTSIKSLLVSAYKFRQSVEKKLKQHPLLSLPELSVDDFVNTYKTAENAENSIYALAMKLGFCVRKKGEFRYGGKSYKANFLQEDGTFILDRMSVLQEIDREKNLLNKPGCGIHIEKGKSHSLFTKYQGVYVLYYSQCVSSLGENSRRPKFIKAAMRISHIFDDDITNIIRVKLNLPNMVTPSSRYQYRGSLIPIGDKDYLSINLHLATKSVNREFNLPNCGELDADTVTILCSRMRDKNKFFSGIITSLNQREAGGTRYPYASKVLIRRQNFSEKQLYNDEEKEFMKRRGLDTYDDMDSLLDSIADGYEKRELEAFFSSDDSFPLNIVGDF